MPSSSGSSGSLSPAEPEEKAKLEFLTGHVHVQLQRLLLLCHALKACGLPTTQPFKLQARLLRVFLTLSYWPCAPPSWYPLPLGINQRLRAPVVSWLARVGQETPLPKREEHLPVMAKASSDGLCGDWRVRHRGRTDGWMCLGAGIGHVGRCAQQSMRSNRF